MKRTLLILLVVSLITISVVIVCNVYSLFFYGIKVKYQRVTGPEFVVLDGAQNLAMNSHTDKNIDYSELFSKTDLDSTTGFLRNSIYIIQGDIVGTKSISENSQKYPIINVAKIMPLKVYYIMLILFFGISFLSLFLLYFIFRGLSCP